MPKFLIEVPHEPVISACERAIQTFLETGSHFLANAGWGCSDDVHKAWMVVELPSRKDALSIVPPSYRPSAKIVKLDNYKLTEPDASLRYHRV